MFFCFGAIKHETDRAKDAKGTAKMLKLMPSTALWFKIHRHSCWRRKIGRVCCHPPASKLGVTVVSLEFAGRAVVGRPQGAKFHSKELAMILRSPFGRVASDLLRASIRDCLVERGLICYMFKCSLRFMRMSKTYSLCFTRLGPLPA